MVAEFIKATLTANDMCDFYGIEPEAGFSTNLSSV
jgi:hypothetical protein